MDTTTEKLNRLSEMLSQHDVINMCFDDLREKILTPEISARLADIETERQTALDAVDDIVATLKAEVIAEVLQSGTSIKGRFLHAVWAKGRTSWNSSGLDGYAIAHPEIVAFRKVGEPSVSIRNVNSG